MCHAASALAVLHCFRVRIAAVSTKKGIPAGIKAIQRCIDRKERIVVPALPVFGLMVEGAALYLDFTGGEITLEIGGVIHSVPQTKFQIAEHGELFFRVGVIGQDQPIHFAVVTQRYKELHISAQAVFCAVNDSIAHAMAAGIFVKFRLNRLPAGVPDGIAFLDVEIAAIGIGGDVIVAVTRDTAELCILVEAITTCRVGDQAEECLAAQIIDPWQRRFGVGDDVLAVCVIEMSELHRSTPFQKSSNRPRNGANCFSVISGRSSSRREPV